MLLVSMQNNIMLSVIKLGVGFFIAKLNVIILMLLCWVSHFYSYAECYYAKCRYAECRGAHVSFYISP